MKNTTLVSGKIFYTLFKYSLPIIIMNMVQCLFNMADVATGNMRTVRGE